MTRTPSSTIPPTFEEPEPPAPLLSYDAFARQLPFILGKVGEIENLNELFQYLDLKGQRGLSLGPTGPTSEPVMPYLAPPDLAPPGEFKWPDPNLREIDPPVPTFIEPDPKAPAIWILHPRVKRTEADRGAVNPNLLAIPPSPGASPGGSSPEDLEAFRRRWLTTFLAQAPTLPGVVSGEPMDYSLRPWLLGFPQRPAPDEDWLMDLLAPRRGR